MAEAASPACSDVVLRLGQHPRAPDTTADFELQWPRYPERLQPVLSQCQTKEQVDRELRDDYEIHRRSANMTLHEYLDTLRRVHAEERSRYIHEICPSQGKASSTAVELREPDSNAPDNTTTREQWRLKILGDSLSRDLLAMQETLELLLIARKKPEQSSSSKWDLFLPRFWFCVGLLNPFLWVMTLYRGAYGLLVYGDAACPLETRKWPRPRRIESHQERINDLYRLLRKGQVGERNRRDLMQCVLEG